MTHGFGGNATNWKLTFFVFDDIEKNILAYHEIQRRPSSQLTSNKSHSNEKGHFGFKNRLSETVFGLFIIQIIGLHKLQLDVM